MFDKKNTRQHFERASETYDASAVLQREVAKRLVERLEYIKIEPATALDIGCGTGYITQDLLVRYPKANTIALDLALKMAQKTQNNATSSWKKWLKKPPAICADAEQLPIKSDSIDLIVSSLMLQWSNDLNNAFRGFHSTLAPNGLLMFTTFGPDTLKEMSQSWAEVDQQPHTSQFSDMHEIGDALLQAGFINPVTDMEVITMTYSSVLQLMKDIKNIGASNTHSDRSKGLMGKQKLRKFEQAYEKFKTEEGLYPASWEIIYGHAWVGEGVKSDNFGSVEKFENVIPIKAI